MEKNVNSESTPRKEGNKTNFTFNVVHPTEEYKIQQEKMGILNGWGSVFDRLDEMLMELK